MPKNLKGDPLGFFNIHSVAKHQKIEGGILFSGKKLKGGTLWDFPTTILTQNTKKIEGGPFGENFFPKSLAVPKKKLKGVPFGLDRYGLLRGKTGKNFLVQFAIWCNNIL